MIIDESEEALLIFIDETLGRIYLLDIIKPDDSDIIFLLQD